MNCEGVLEEIENRCADVLYRNESEASEVHAFQSPNNVRGAFNAAGFLASLNMPPLTPIEERDFNHVLNNQIELEEGASGWEILQSYLTANLVDLKVFVIGKVQVDIYAVGLFTDNEIIGVKTNATET